MDNLDALLERLRFCAGPWSDPNLAKNAADAIRELRAELAQAVQTVRELGAVQATINAERDSLRAERDDYKVQWQRDSTALGKTLNELSMKRAVIQDLRASLAAVEKERDEIKARLVSHAMACPVGDLWDFIRQDAALAAWGEK
jgi:chromosome segregation ATPase